MSKKILREKYLGTRRELSEKRIRQASQAVQEELDKRIQGDGIVLSYSGLKDELHPSAINHHLAKEGRLALTRIEGDHLKPYLILDLCADTEVSNLGIREPIKNRCTPIDLEDISQIIVPGIAFDKRQMRLGFGYGYYDRLLSACTKAKSIGIGFTEQLHPEGLPHEPHDRPVDELILR